MGNDVKIGFLKHEFWVLSISAAFSRANVYNKEVSVEKKEFDQLKVEFKNKLKKYVFEVSESYNQDEKVTLGFHIENISKIITLSENYSSILMGDKLKFGVAQKLLNLVLKYFWCSGIIKEPPHCPIDRIIQGELYGKYSTKIIAWTKLDDIEVYMKIIGEIKKEANKESLSIAKWELNKFQRR